MATDWEYQSLSPVHIFMRSKSVKDNGKVYVHSFHGMNSCKAFIILEICHTDLIEISAVKVSILFREFSVGRMGETSWPGPEIYQQHWKLVFKHQEGSVFTLNVGVRYTYREPRRKREASLQLCIVCLHRDHVNGP